MILESDHIATILEGTGWTQRGRSITKTYKYNTFIEAIQFVNGVADLAEEMNHHPEIEIHYNRVKLTLSTHSEGGVTEQDTTLALAIEEDCA